MDLTARFLIERAELSASAGFVLNRVNREGPIRLTSLAAKEGVSQPAMTQLIQRLERQGLVARLCDPEDGRAALIDITDEGRSLLGARRLARRERLTQLLETLPAEEQYALWLSLTVASPILYRVVAQAESPSEADGSELTDSSERRHVG
jgi:DNA-binding MarR family transcriptional regulator